MDSMLEYCLRCRSANLDVGNWKVGKIVHNYFLLLEVGARRLCAFLLTISPGREA